MTDSSQSTSDGLSDSSTYPGWDVMVLLLLVAVLPAAFATGFSQFEYLKEWILVSGVGVAVALWAVRMSFADAVRVEAGRVAGLGLAVAGYALAAVFWAETWSAGLGSALPVVAGFVAFWIAMSGDHRPTFGEFSTAVAVGVFVSAILGALDWFGIPVFSVVWDPPGATGAFDAMEFAAAYYMVAIPIVAAAAVRFEGIRSALMAVALGVGALHFGATATWTLLTLLVAAVLFSGGLAAVFQPSEAGVMTPAAGGVLAILLAGVVAGHSQHGVPTGMQEAVSVPLLSETTSAEQQRLEQNRPWNAVFSIGRMESVDALETRRYLASVGYTLWWESPLLGHGPGGWWHLQTKEAMADHPAVQRRFRQYPAYRAPHNAFVHVAVEYGLIGGALLLVWLLSCGGLAVAAIGREPEPIDILVEQWGLIGALISGVTAAAVTAFWTVSPAFLIWVLSLAVLLRISSAMTGSSEGAVEWELVSLREDGWTLSRASAVVLASVLAVGMVAASLFQGTSRLYRGYADHAMLYTAYTKASKLYDRVGDWWPKPGDVAYNQALAEQRSVGGSQDAGTLLERAAERRPYDTRVLAEQAQLDLRNNRLSEATRLGYRAVSAYPNSFAARSVLTTALKQSNRPDEAANELIEYLDRNPPTELEIQTRQSLADLYLSIDEPQNAKEHLEAALEAAELRSTKKMINKKLKKVEQKLQQKERRREGKLPEGQQKDLPPTNNGPPSVPSPSP